MEDNVVLADSDDPSEGASSGEVLSEAIRLGDDTLFLKNIASMTRGEFSFQPNKNNIDRAWASVIYPTIFIIFGVIAVLNIWSLLSNDGLSVIFSPDLIWLLFSILAIFRSIALRKKINYKKNYYTLRIGTSDGRHVRAISDDQSGIKMLHDIINEKVNTGDKSITGYFDFSRNEFDFSDKSINSGGDMKNVNTGTMNNSSIGDTVNN